MVGQYALTETFCRSLSTPSYCFHTLGYSCLVVVCKYRNRVLEIGNWTEPNLKNPNRPGPTRADSLLSARADSVRVWASHSLKHMIMQTGASILWNAECGKLSRGNLRKISCGTFCKLPLIASPHSAAEKNPHFRGLQNYRSLALYNRCETDAQQHQASRGHFLPYSLWSICQRTG